MTWGVAEGATCAAHMRALAVDFPLSLTPSFPRTRESIVVHRRQDRRAKRHWIPAFAGMTWGVARGATCAARTRALKFDFPLSLTPLFPRTREPIVVHRRQDRRAKRHWIPAFAGMTWGVAKGATCAARTRALEVDFPLSLPPSFPRTRESSVVHRRMDENQIPLSHGRLLAIFSISLLHHVLKKYIVYLI